MTATLDINGLNWLGFLYLLDHKLIKHQSEKCRKGDRSMAQDQVFLKGGELSFLQ